MSYIRLAVHRAEPMPTGIPAAESWTRDIYFLDGPTGNSPVVNLVRAHWEKIRDSRIFPRRKEVDPLQIWSALPYLTLADYMQDPFRVRMALIGTEVGRQCRGLKERCFLDQMNLPIEDMVDRTEVYTRAHDRRHPIYGLSRMLLEDYSGHVLEWAVFPLSHDGECITSALGVSDYSALIYR